jgi:alcohol dehydrogenase
MKRGDITMREMRVARLHSPGTPFQIDVVPTPQPRHNDVLVEVKACGVVPNMKAVVSGKYWHTLPALPAVYGLDATGVVKSVGSGVHRFAVGDRVYINPLLFCGSCHYCRNAQPQLCDSMALRGYFGNSPESKELMADYPYGGFSEYLTAAAQSLVKLPDNVSFEEGTRVGYLCTSFAALKAAGMRQGCWVIVNGATGTLGVGAVMVALALGATRVLSIGRNRELLARLKQLAPSRVETLALGDEDIAEWARRHTDGIGADIMLDCLGRGASGVSTENTIKGLKRGGRAINIGALSDEVKLDPTWFMLNQISFMGSNWFTVADAEQMVDLIRGGLLDLSELEHKVFPLELVNDALNFAAGRPGGFANVVVAP